MAHLLTPGSKFVRRLPLDPAVKAYLFRDGRRLVCVVWAVPSERPQLLRLKSPELRLFDIMGRPMPERQCTPGGTPVYVVAEGVSDDQFEAAVR